MGARRGENGSADVDAYIAGCAEEVQPLLRSIRAVFHRVRTDVTERISYGMPTIESGERHGFYFAAWKKHIGLYPIPVLDDDLEAELAGYRAATDTIRLPLHQPLPLELLERVVRAVWEPDGAGDG
jgi:uncharacterized protein YdhG (YjbR/CyaY superfamily)